MQDDCQYGDAFAEVRVTGKEKGNMEVIQRDRG